ncbi:MAG: restriction endonuclease subunit S [Thomasclavelia spiroformis]|uniref:restriction endonuclease subunit S n=1 Tax=Thomasclavelia spiroformis TaxID=29348 RepID=UPI003990DFA3
MKTEIKQLIEQIKNGEVPQGYKKTKIGIVPNEWREISFDTIFKEFSVYTNDMGKYPLYSLTIENGIVEKTDRYERSHLVKKENSYKLLPIDYYAYNPMNIRFGAVARNKSNKDVMISGYYDIFTTKEKSDLKFMDSFLISNKMITYYNKVSTGSLLEKQRVHFSQFINFELPLPKQMDRKKIAEILSIQDKVIELKEKLIEEKKKQKKYLMQNLLTGKMRLKGFTDEWKKYVMGNLGNTYSGLSGKNKDDFGKGKPYIPYTNIFLNPIIDVNELGYVDVLENEKQSKVCYGDIFFTTSSETPEEVGMSSVLLENVDELYLNSFCFGFRLNNFSVLSPIYASHYFRGDTFRNILNRLAQGATRFNLSKNNLLKSILLLPPLEEQKAIAEILSTQDKEIELLQKQLEQEKQKKKALLQLLLTGIVRV